MFGPNIKADFGGEYFHHREPRFHSLLRDVEHLFQERFGLSDYDILFLTGSGTLANEIIMSSFQGDIRVLEPDTEFGGRLRQQRLAHFRDVPNLRIQGLAYVHYETSISCLHLTPRPWLNALLFADMVSAFPYYLVPETVDVFTTVSSKQLGAYPVLGVLGLRKGLRLEWFFRRQPGSLLDLFAHWEAREQGETVHTAALPLYQDLLEELEGFDQSALVQRIDQRRIQLLSCLPSEEVLGEGPVLTCTPGGRVEALADRFHLYRNRLGCYQLFLWAGQDEEYQQFCEALRTV